MPRRVDAAIAGERRQAQALLTAQQTQLTARINALTAENYAAWPRNRRTGRSKWHNSKGRLIATGNCPRQICPELQVQQNRTISPSRWSSSSRSNAPVPASNATSLSPAALSCHAARHGGRQARHAVARRNQSGADIARESGTARLRSHRRQRWHRRACHCLQRPDGKGASLVQMQTYCAC